MKQTTDDADIGGVRTKTQWRQHSRAGTTAQAVVACLLPEYDRSKPQR